MRFIIPVESLVQNKGGVILYDPFKNKIIKEYVHDKKWDRVGWRGGILHKGYLIATDWTDLHYFNIEKWRYEKSFKFRTFNDLHYVKVFNDQLYVVSTGLDRIEVFDNPLNPVHNKSYVLYKLNNKLFKEREFSKNIDYNNKYKIKPHSAHPNCIEFKDKMIFVTCFEKQHKQNTGEVVELTTGGTKVLKKCHDCHDGIFYKDKFFLTKTRHNKIIVFKDITNKNKWPISRINKTYNLPKGSWWRGMVIYDDFLFVMSSDGYRKTKSTIQMCVLNLKDESKKVVLFPVNNNTYWDTVYQPNLLL